MTIKIENRLLDNITWQNGAGCPCVINDHIDVWSISVSGNLGVIADFLAVMPQHEIDKAYRFYQAADRDRHIITHGGLRHILGRYLNQLPQSMEFKEGPNKKPFIAGAADLFFNLSHSGDRILIAVSNSEVGADTEFINKQFKYEDIIFSNFNTDEINFITESDAIERFFLLWTRKEALIKATGQGLNDNLRLITCIEGAQTSQSEVMGSPNDWLVNSFKVDGHHVASIAGNNNVAEINFWKFNF